MKLGDEIKDWIGDYVENKEDVKELSAALVHVFQKHNFKTHKRKFGAGLICGMLLMIIILKWLH